MPIKLKKINNKWYTPDNRLYVGSAIQDRNIYWYGTDGSRTYLRRKGVYRPSPEIINYVKRTEAFSPTWYKDGNGHWTIGYGMKETSELRRKYPHSITKELADAEFLNLANTYSLEMYLNTPNAQALNQNQLDALFSYYYNLGLTNYTRKSPAFQNALKSANWNEVINLMDFGYNDTKNPGLKKRRDYERQLFQVPVTIPKHYKGGQLIKHNINIYKQGENMKVKDNNQTTLIPRHLTGGLVRKYQLAAGSRGIERYKPTFTDRIVLMSRNTPQNRTVNSAIVATKYNTGLPISTWPKYTSNTNKTMNTWRNGETTMYINDNRDSIGLDGTIYNSDGHVIGTDGTITTASKPAQTNIVDKSSKRNNKKMTVKRNSKSRNTNFAAKPTTITFTESPTNITDQGWLNARNAAMQRGWGTYNYNGLTYQFTGDEFLQASRNWNNRRKAGYQAEGILDLNPPVEVTAMIPRGDGEVKPEDAIIEKNTSIDTKTTPYTFLYQRQLTNNPNLIRDMLWLATQDVRNGKQDASYYGESSNLVSQLANANQDSAKNYIYNLWNTNNDIATQAGRKNYTESQGLTFGEPTTTFNWLNDVREFLNKNKRFSKAKQGTKLIRRRK